MSFAELETLIDSRVDLLSRLSLLERDDVAETVTRKIEDDLREREYAEWDRVNVPFDRFDTDWECLCA